MNSLHSALPLIPLQLPDLPIYEHAQLFIGTAACLAAAGVFARAYLVKSESNLPLPPSPPNWTFQGHTLPPRRPFLTMAEWIDEYGPVITTRSRFTKVVIVGSYKAAVEIMENQGKSVADRPRSISAGELFSGGMSLTFAPVGERFRRMRKALHSHLQPKAAETYQPLQSSHAKNVVLNILDDPHNFRNHVLSYAATTVMKVAYGKSTPTSATHPEVIELHRNMEVFAKLLRPGAFLVDSIPWLKYLPWYGRELKRGYETYKRIHTGQLNRVGEQIKSNEDTGPSLARFILENREHGLGETESAFLVGSMFSAGSDTTGSAICTVLMAAARFPEEQAKVQAELDAVVGRHQAPTFADQKSLPRMQAFIYEALRWRPLATNGVPHRTNEDVIWAIHQENYRIPAGTTVYGNHWSITRDPDAYPEPDAFKPERWIDDHGNLKENINLFFIYGFGRRVCPGQHLAQRSVFISTLLVIWAFRLTLDPTKPVDDMEFIIGEKADSPCVIEFEARVPDAELRHIMEEYCPDS
ncbi:cytochrome P450 [Suillus clintonianus]|uniref:cytochrome P450 n=1 Tax=Suillus clintonianus TaxID=1904413 RepID=UPI001B87A4CC|nr:cytochrome P450 [Suillus clintonianus]KAG2136697.1 cytochrome P450 [Suillus clintonianus]